MKIVLISIKGLLEFLIGIFIVVRHVKSHSVSVLAAPDIKRDRNQGIYLPRSIFI